MDKYLRAIRKNICSICVDSTETGKCTLNEHENCALELYLPKIVEIVHSTQSEEMEDYVRSLRYGVCLDCRAQEEDGSCYLREDINCALDRYFPLIVETIQTVDKESQ
jgi:hypothetical protein